MVVITDANEHPNNSLKPPLLLITVIGVRISGLLNNELVELLLVNLQASPNFGNASVVMVLIERELRAFVALERVVRGLLIRRQD